MDQTPIGGEPNDPFHVMARATHEPDFPQIFFPGQGTRRQNRFKNEPDDSEVIPLVLQALERLTE